MKSLLVENVKTKEQKRYVNTFIMSKYLPLVLLARRKQNDELYSLYQEHKKEWREGLKESYKKTISIKNFSVIDYIKYIVTLYCPQYYKYTRLSTLKRIIKGNS